MLSRSCRCSLQRGSSIAAPWRPQSSTWARYIVCCRGGRSASASTLLRWCWVWAHPASAALAVLWAAGGEAVGRGRGCYHAAPQHPQSLTWALPLSVHAAASRAVGSCRRASAGSACRAFVEATFSGCHLPTSPPECLWCKAPLSALAIWLEACPPRCLALRR